MVGWEAESEGVGKRHSGPPGTGTCGSSKDFGSHSQGREDREASKKRGVLVCFIS